MILLCNDIFASAKVKVQFHIIMAKQIISLTKGQYHCEYNEQYH